MRLKSIFNDGFFSYLKRIGKKNQKISQAIKEFLELNSPLFGKKNLQLDTCDNEKCFSEGCNITNLPQIYNIILQKSKNIETVIKKLHNRIKARIYKTKEIKRQWSKRYAKLTDVEGLEINYSIYPNSLIATERIFTDIFKISKIGNQAVLNPTVNIKIFIYFIYFINFEYLFIVLESYFLWNKR